MRIVFMGTPPFAVSSLANLHESQHQVVGVVTAPDKPAGRGRKLRPSAVKNYAQDQGLPLLQPEKLRAPDFLVELSELAPDLIVVVAFRMLPRAVWSLPPKGTINLHASLLPYYRGAAPINWAIINGERETGLSTFFLDEQIDTGATIFQKRISITEDDTAGSLHDKMLEPGAQLVLKTVDAIAKGAPPRAEQRPVKNAATAPKISPADTWVNFDAPLSKVYNHIRGMAPYPGARALLRKDEDSREVKFLAVAKGSPVGNNSPGSIATDGKNYWKIACQDRFLKVEEAQIAGKKRLKTQDILNGFSLSPEHQIVINY